MNPVMNQVDTAIAYLLESDGDGLGTNGKGGGGGSWGGGGGGYGGGQPSGRQRTTSDIIGGITDITGLITRGVVESRRARYGRGGAATAAGGGGGGGGGDLDLMGGSGVAVRTPWGRIFIGGAAILIIGGVVVWAVTKEPKPPVR